MKFKFLTHRLMANNLLKSIVASGAIIATGVSAETPNLNSATSVAVSRESIDFKSKIASIDIQLVQIQTKISIIEQKNDLSDQDFDSIDLLDKEFKKLTAEKLAIVDNQNEHKKETKNNKLKQLSITEHKLAALDRVSKVLNK